MPGSSIRVNNYGMTERVRILPDFAEFFLIDDDIVTAGFRIIVNNQNFFIFFMLA